MTKGRDVPPPKDEPKPGSIYVMSGYGANTQQPFIEIDYTKSQLNTQTWTLKLDVDDARDHAMNILQACEAAIQDAFLIDFAKELGMTKAAEQAHLLHLFRAMRRDRQNDDTA